MSLAVASRRTFLTVILLVIGLVVPTAASAPMAGAASAPALVEIRAAHHRGFDRIVFEFDGPVPAIARAAWARDLRLDPSWLPAHVQGNAFLRVWFSPALGHQEAPRMDPTFGPARRAFALPNIAHVVLLGDFEAHLSFGVGLMARTRILRTARLSDPGRFVADVATDFPKAWASVYFVDEVAVQAGEPPFVTSVLRKVPRTGKAVGAMQRLYAGPTAAERARGLRFMASGTKGFRDLRIGSRGIARVTLRGRCDSGGAAGWTVADQIAPTLRSRPAVDWVKVYDRFGQTGRPWGLSDSIPACLEP